MSSPDFYRHISEHTHTSMRLLCMFGICFVSLLACLDSEKICNRGAKVNARQAPYRHNDIMMKAKYSIICVPSARDQLPKKRLFLKDQNKMQLEICTLTTTFYFPNFSVQVFCEKHLGLISSALSHCVSV